MLEATGAGLAAAGTGGLAATGPPPTAGGLGGAGFAATGGGLGLEATGGGALVPVGVDLPEVSDIGVLGFFHGAADPLAAAMPGNTGTGFAEALAATVVGAILGVGVGTGRVLGGGGGAAGAALGGTSSR